MVKFVFSNYQGILWNDYAYPMKIEHNQKKSVNTETGDIQ